MTDHAQRARELVKAWTFPDISPESHRDLSTSDRENLTCLEESIVDALTQAHAAGRREGMEELEGQLEQLGDSYFHLGNTQARLAIEAAERQQLATVTAERDAYKAQCQCMYCGTHYLNISVCSKCTFTKPAAEPFKIKALEQQLAASQARCREMEQQLPKEMPNCTILFRECPYGHGRLTATNWLDHGCDTCKLTHLQATLAAREARIHDLEQELEEYRSLAEIVGASKAVSARDAAVQEVGRLKEALEALWRMTSIHKITDLDAHAVIHKALEQQARGSSGGAANHGAQS